MSPAKNKIVIIDVEKVERLTRELVDTVNEHFSQETLTGPEVVMALETVAYHVMKAHVEFKQGLQKLVDKTIAV